MRHGETLGGEGYVLYINCVDGFTGSYISQNLPNCTLDEYGLLFINDNLVIK